VRETLWWVFVVAFGLFRRVGTISFDVQYFRLLVKGARGAGPSVQFDHFKPSERYRRFCLCTSLLIKCGEILVESGGLPCVVSVSGNVVQLAIVVGRLWALLVTDPR